MFNFNFDDIIQLLFYWYCW